MPIIVILLLSVLQILSSSYDSDLDYSYPSFLVSSSFFKPQVCVCGWMEEMMMAFGGSLLRCCSVRVAAVAWCLSSHATKQPHKTSHSTTVLLLVLLRCWLWERKIQKRGGSMMLPVMLLMTVVWWWPPFILPPPPVQKISKSFCIDLVDNKLTVGASCLVSMLCTVCHEQRQQ